MSSGCTALDITQHDMPACVDRLLPFLEMDTVGSSAIDLRSELCSGVLPRRARATPRKATARMGSLARLVSDAVP